MKLHYKQNLALLPTLVTLASCVSAPYYPPVEQPIDCNTAIVSTFVALSNSEDLLDACFAGKKEPCKTYVYYTRYISIQDIDKSIQCIEGGYLDPNTKGFSTLSQQAQRVAQKMRAFKSRYFINGKYRI